MYEDAKIKSSISHMGKKSSEEARKKQSLSMIGVNDWSLGNKHGCGNKGKVSPKKGIPLSKEHNLKNRISHIGQKSWNKIGDVITSLYILVRVSHKMNEWKAQVRGRDNWICQKCGCKGWMEAHHIIQFSELMIGIKTVNEAMEFEPLWDLNNGITYCKKCHKLLKNKGGLL